MRCPRCNVALEPGELQGVDVLECPSCKGLWLKAEDLRRLKDDRDESLRWVDFDLFAAARNHGHPSRLKCPVCGLAMEALAYEHSSVRVDLCPRDRGVWLDGGELGRIVEALEGWLNAMTAREYETNVTRQFAEIFSGRESLGSEVKDFLAVFKLFETRLGAEHPMLAAVIDRLGAGGF